MLPIAAMWPTVGLSKQGGRAALTKVVIKLTVNVAINLVLFRVKPRTSSKDYHCPLQYAATWISRGE